MALAGSRFSGIVNASRERTAAHQLVAMLATARLNALTHSMPTGLCDYQNGTYQRTWQTLTVAQTAKKRRILRPQKAPKSIVLPTLLQSGADFAGEMSSCSTNVNPCDLNGFKTGAPPVGSLYRKTLGSENSTISSATLISPWNWPPASSNR